VRGLAKKNVQSQNLFILIFEHAAESCSLVSTAMGNGQEDANQGKFKYTKTDNATKPSVVNKQRHIHIYSKVVVLLGCLAA
jgi:hypothetical protein